MPKSVTEKAAELKEKIAASKKFWDDNAEVELKDFTDDQKQTIDTLNKEIEALNADIVEAKGYEGARAQQEAMMAAIGQPIGRPQFANTDPAQLQQGRKSMGQMFVESEEFMKWRERDLGIKEVGDEPSEGVKIHMQQPFEIKDAKGLIISGNPLAGTGSLNSGGAFVRREYAPTVDLPLRPLTIRQLVSNGTTTSNMIEYVRVITKTRAAAVVPEATATSGAGFTAALKPEAGMAVEIVQEGVKTIAVTMPITRQILSDAPQLQSMIDNFLFDDLDLVLEEEIISGTGAGTHFRGLENTPGITPQPRAPGDADLLVTTRKAITTAMVVGRARASGFLFNPYDWQDIDLLRNATAGNFYFGGPTVMGVDQLWGRPVAQSEVIPQGTGYSGDLKQIMIWDRERGTLRVTDSHADWFRYNILCILAELRAAMTVSRPAAIVKIDLVVGANS